ncbi:HIRA-interacting protein 5, partial [Wilcoxina mikolae CBS 423.85]
RSMFIQTETTPNPSALKFLPGVSVLPSGAQSMEYLDGRETHSSPLARKLFSVDGIRSVFYGPDFITVTKSEDANWAHIKPEVFSLITEALNAGGSVVTVGETVMAEDTAPQEGDSEVVAMIKELLDTRIRPAIQEDGGDIEFRGFDEGKGEVKLKLRGACRTCDSSTVTLKNGIESMLMHYIEEVKMVTQVMDQEEEIAAKEFERFEERLRMAKGPQATASSPLDTVE